MDMDEQQALLSQSRSEPADNPPNNYLSTGSPLSHAAADPDPESSLSMVRIIIPCAIGIFLAAMDGTVVASSYASIGSELKQLQNTSWIATGYMLTLTSFQPLYGKLSDIFGRKSCLLFAYSVFAFGCLCCGLARDITELIAARAVAGLGGGGMTTVVSILVSDVVPLRSRGTWQGLLNIVFATGSAVGAPLGGIMADGIGWRWAFLIQVPISVLAIISVAFLLHLPAKSQSDDLSSKLKRVDFGGAIFLVLAVFFLLLGLDRGGNVSWSDTLSILALSASALFFVCFTLVEIFVANEPFAPKHIIAHESLFAAYLCNFFGVAAGMCLVFHVPLYFQAVAQKSASESGLALLPAVFGGVSGSLIGGIYMQKSGKYFWLTAIMYLNMFLGSIAILLVSGLVVQSLPGVSAGLFVTAFGNGVGVTSTLVALIANAAFEDQAIATAVSYLFRSLGSVVGVSVGSTLVQNTLRTYLRARLPGRGDEVDEIVNRVRESLDSISSLDPTTQVIVRKSYQEAVWAAFQFAAALALLCTISAFFIHEKPLVRRGLGEGEQAQVQVQREGEREAE